MKKKFYLDPIFWAKLAIVIPILYLAMVFVGYLVLHTYPYYTAYIKPIVVLVLGVYVLAKKNKPVDEKKKKHD